MALCCPLPTAPTTITPTVCAFNIKEVHRIYAVRKDNLVWNISTPASNIGAPSGAAPEDSAGWTTLRTNADSTKVLTLPLFGSEPTIVPGGELSTVGLANTKNHSGYDPSEFAAFFEGLTAVQERDINEVTCEGANWEIYFIMFDKTILGAIDTATSNLFTGIDVASAITLLGRSVNGPNENDKNGLGFQLLHEWSQTMHAITPTFNTLTF